MMKNRQNEEKVAIEKMEKDDFCEELNVLDKLNAWIKKSVSVFDAIIFLSAFFVGIFVHLYMFMHKFINHDDIGGLYSNCDFGLSSGRWLLHIVTGFNGNFSSSWLNGLAGSLYLAIAVLLVIRLFRVKHYVPAILIELAMIAFPTVASTYAYMFCSAQYLFSLAFSVIGAYCIYKGTVKWMCAGVIALALSMGCYQAYFCLATVLLVVALGMDLCENRFEGNWKSVVLTGLKYVVCLLLGMLLYMIVLRVCLWYTGTELVSYQGINAMGEVTFEQLRQRIDDAYCEFFEFYNNTDIFHRYFPVLVKFCWALDLFYIIFSIIKNKIYYHATMLLFLAALIFILPLSANLIYVMTEAETVHLVMRYSMLVPLIIPAIGLDRIKIRAYRGSWLSDVCRKGTLAIAMLTILTQFACGYEFFLITNRAYFSMDLTYENAYAYYVKLTTKIELQDGYTKDSPVAFIGYASMDNHVPPTYMTGVLIGDEALNIYTRSQFLSYFLGSDYIFASTETCAKIQGTKEFEKMPCYPEEGSIQTINGVIVVKFS